MNDNVNPVNDLLDTISTVSYILSILDQRGVNPPEPFLTFSLIKIIESALKTGLSTKYSIDFNRIAELSNEWKEDIKFLKDSPLGFIEKYNNKLDELK